MGRNQWVPQWVANKGPEFSAGYLDGLYEKTHESARATKAYVAGLSVGTDRRAELLLDLRHYAAPTEDVEGDVNDERGDVEGPAIDTMYLAVITAPGVEENRMVYYGPDWEQAKIGLLREMYWTKRLHSFDQADHELDWDDLDKMISKLEGKSSGEFEGEFAERQWVIEEITADNEEYSSRIAGRNESSKCRICGSTDVVTIADWHSRNGLHHVGTFGFCEEHKNAAANWSGQVRERRAAQWEEKGDREQMVVDTPEGPKVVDVEQQDDGSYQWRAWDSDEEDDVELVEEGHMSEEEAKRNAEDWARQV